MEYSPLDLEKQLIFPFRRMFSIESIGDELIHKTTIRHRAITYFEFMCFAVCLKFQTVWCLDDRVSVNPAHSRIDPKKSTRCTSVLRRSTYSFWCYLLSIVCSYSSHLQDWEKRNNFHFLLFLFETNEWSRCMLELIHERLHNLSVVTSKWVNLSQLNYVFLSL